MSEQTAVRTRKNGFDDVKSLPAYWSYWDISFRVRRRRIFCQRMTCISGSIRRSIISMCRCSLPIFLMHTLFAAPTRAVLLKVGVTNAAAHVVLGLGISFVGPIVAAWVMKKTKYLEFFLYPNKVIKATSKCRN